MQCQRDPTAEGMTHHDHPVGEEAVGLEERDELRRVASGAPGIRRCGRGPEAGQIGRERAERRPGRVAEHAVEVGVGPCPTVEGEHGRAGVPPGGAEQAAADEGLQHRHTLPIASAGVEPRPEGSALFEDDVHALTDSQRSAVWSPACSLCIVAGAGSGKTRVLTLRMARRIREGSAAADHTVACTFTRKAARELGERLQRYGIAVSTRTPSTGMPAPGVRTGTIHRLALGVLRRHALDTGRPVPVIADDRFARLVRILEDPAVAAAVDAEIGWAKARGLTPVTYPSAAIRAG